MKKIYVVAFGPSEDSPRQGPGAGGCTWHHTRDDALTQLIQDSSMTSGYDYYFFEASVPEELLQKEPDAGQVEKYLEEHYTDKMI